MEGCMAHKGDSTFHVVDGCVNVACCFGMFSFAIKVKQYAADAF